ncbi:uncharacterized protein [Montipora capricornis]|uniref:uncharacterized protein isoform X2 n=1 Tax=Montipora capricornis TaxID=246305 RepID=UPI0035F1B840
MMMLLRKDLVPSNFQQNFSTVSLNGKCPCFFWFGNFVLIIMSNIWEACFIRLLASCLFRAAHQEPEDMSYESDGEEDENGDEVGDGEDSVSEKTDKKAKKAGRKAKWSQSLLDDTIDEPFTDFKNLVLYTVGIQSNSETVDMRP